MGRVRILLGLRHVPEIVSSLAEKTAALEPKGTIRDMGGTGLQAGKKPARGLEAKGSGQESLF